MIYKWYYVDSFHRMETTRTPAAGSEEKPEETTKCQLQDDTMHVCQQNKQPSRQITTRDTDKSNLQQFTYL